MKNKGIYYLLNDDKIVYIGKSLSSMKSRVDMHIKDEVKEFDSVIYHKIENISDINILEVAMIAKHSPIYNKDCVTDHKTNINNLNIEDFTAEIIRIDREVFCSSQVSMFPVNSKDRTMIYMNDFTRITELNKTEQLMFFAILQNCDGYNIVKASWKDIAKDITSDQSRISKTIKQLKDLNFIAKVESKHMVNPFIVLPKYDKNERESQWLCQQVWKLYTEDMNIYIPDDYIPTVRYMLGLKESTHIKVGNKKSEEQSKIVEKPNNKNS